MKKKNINKIEENTMKRKGDFPFEWHISNSEKNSRTRSKESKGEKKGIDKE